MSDPWDLIVVAHAPAEVRRRRLVDLRGLDEQDAAARIASQVSDEERLSIADAVIETAGSLESTLRPDRRTVGAPRRSSSRRDRRGDAVARSTLESTSNGGAA